MLARAYELATTSADGAIRAKAACALGSAIGQAGQGDRAEQLLRTAESTLPDSPQFALHLVRKLASRVRVLTDNIRSLALMDVYGRVARLLLELAEEKDGRLVVSEPLTHKDIASRVGCSRIVASSSGSLPPTLILPSGHR